MFWRNSNLNKINCDHVSFSKWWPFSKWPPEVRYFIILLVVHWWDIFRYLNMFFEVEGFDQISFKHVFKVFVHFVHKNSLVLVFVERWKHFWQADGVRNTECDVSINTSILNFIIVPSKSGFCHISTRVQHTNLLLTSTPNILWDEESYDTIAHDIRTN